MRRVILEMATSVEEAGRNNWQFDAACAESADLVA